MTTTVDFEDIDPGISITDTTTTPGTTYLGRADAGTSRSAAIWQIRKYFTNVDGDTELAWADGDAEADNVWADRASLVYVGSTA